MDIEALIFKAFDHVKSELVSEITAKLRTSDCRTSYDHDAYRKIDWLTIPEEFAELLRDVFNAGIIKLPKRLCEEYAVFACTIRIAGKIGNYCFCVTNYGSVVWYQYWCNSFIERRDGSNNSNVHVFPGENRLTAHAIDEIIDMLNFSGSMFKPQHVSGCNSSGNSNINNSNNISHRCNSCNINNSSSGGGLACEQYCDIVGVDTIAADELAQNIARYCAKKY